MNFATELSLRLQSYESFQSLYTRLQQTAAARTLPEPLETVDAGLASEDIRRLLYCASVFAQAQDERAGSLAQNIALNALLIGREDVPARDSLRLLTDLGNFPALSYAEQRLEPSADTFGAITYRAAARTLNAIQIGDDTVSLTDFQKHAWNGLSHYPALAISAPTSAGKSFLVIEHLCRTALGAEQFSAVYVAPTRALLSEVYASIKRRTANATDLRVSTVPTPNTEGHRRQIFVLTQERLQVLLAVSPEPFDLVIVDEAQNFSDGARGMILQECIEQALSRDPQTRIVLLAPGAESFRDVERALGLDNLEPAISRLASVIQNRILVKKADEPNAIELTLLTAEGPQTLGILKSGRGFDLPANRLAAVALELGLDGGSLVYATGPSDAEKAALQISQDRSIADSHQLQQLADFIEKHIHSEYSLAKLVRKGVAFHYGKMPTLLREALEGAFKSGSLSFLVCTTTLFQGVNLPARNVFIDTPLRGRGTQLDPAAMWNFAGRAGRMKSDIVGNVFLVDYEDWPEKPMDEFVAYRIEPAFGKTLREQRTEVLTALSGDMPRLLPRDESAPRIRAAAGLLIAHAARGAAAEFVSRALADQPDSEQAALVEASEAASESVGLPPSLLQTNWTVDPFGLRRLYDDIVTKIAAGETAELIPPSPHDGWSARERYVSIFMRIQRAVNRSETAFHALIAGIAVDWMQGQPYPAMLARAVKRETSRWHKKVAEYEIFIAANPTSRKRRPRKPKIDDIIRREFDHIEDQVRFTYVQLGKAYVDLLVLALTQAGNQERIREIFDFPLALELGVATRSGWSFMELGLSRIAASALEPHFPDSNLDVERARDWLRSTEIASLRLSPIIVAELERLGLAGPELATSV